MRLSTLSSKRGAMTKRLLAHWDAADNDVKRAGRNWYPIIADRAAALAPELPRCTVLGVLAVLSPRITVAQNLYDAETVLTGRPYVTSAFAANVDKARRLLAGESFDAVNGPAPKVRAFLANLLGDVDRVTVDTWMLTVMLGLPVGERGLTITPAQYRYLERVIADAAARRNVSPRTFQATVWIQARKAAF